MNPIMTDTEIIDTESLEYLCYLEFLNNIEYQNFVLEGEK